MANAYEEMADIMMDTVAIQMSGITRQDLISRFKAKFPVESDFQEFLTMTRTVAEMQFAAATAALQPGQTLAIAWPLEAAPSVVH